MKIGSRIQVFRGNASKTVGGLKKEDLMRNQKTRRIVSRRKSQLAKKQNRLGGYLRRPGEKFSLAKKGEMRTKSKSSRKKTSTSRKTRGSKSRKKNKSISRNNKKSPTAGKRKGRSLPKSTSSKKKLCRSKNGKFKKC